MQSDLLRTICILSAVIFLATGCAARQSVFISSASETGSELPAPEEEGEAVRSEAAEIYVYVCGEVEKPGVYRLQAGARLYEAINQAGGLTEHAAAAAVNQARALTDGEEVYVPAEGEAEADAGTVAADDGKININTADLAELTTLAGIGETKAAAIIAWREEHGGFSSVEELLNVDGIAEKTFEKIKDEIRVS